MVQEHTPQATFSPPLDSKQHEAVNIPIVPGLKEKTCKKSYPLFVLFTGNSLHLCPYGKVNSACSNASGEICGLTHWNTASICF